MSTHPKEELDRLRDRLSKIGPAGWFVAEGPEGLLRAERLGSSDKHEQAAMRPEALIDAVTQREAQIEAGNVGSRPPVVTGLGSTATYQKS